MTCQVEGCENGAKAGGNCTTHGGGARCKFEGCGYGAKAGGNCTTHGGGARCKFQGCGYGARAGAGGHCITHAALDKRPRCKFVGCSTFASSRGYCYRHRSCVIPANGTTVNTNLIKRKRNSASSTGIKPRKLSFTTGCDVVSNITPHVEVCRQPDIINY